MLYTKHTSDDITIIAGITENNLFTKCSKCGKETAVNLNNLITAGCKDPYNIEIVCQECTYKMMNLDPADYID